VLIFSVYRFSECTCSTNAVASPSGVTWALSPTVINIKVDNDRFCNTIFSLSC